MDRTASKPAWGSALQKFLWIGLTSFGSGRWIYLHSAFVRNNWIREDVFLRDFAMSQVLPGAGFVNLIVLCGLRLRGLPMALAGLAVATLPGAILMVGAVYFLSGSDPRVLAALHGVLIGAVGLLFATFVRLSRSVRSRSDVAFATATLLLTIAGVPLLLTFVLVGAIGIWRYGLHAGPAR